MKSLFATLGLCLCAAAPSFAATLHTTQAITQCDASTISIENTILSTGPSSDDVSILVKPIEGLCTGGAVAIAVGGRVGASAFVSGSRVDSSFFDASSSGFAELRYSATVKAPIQQAGVPVPVSINLFLEGNLGGEVARVFDEVSGVEVAPNRQTVASLIWKGSITGEGNAQTFGDRRELISTPSDEAAALLPVALPIVTPTVMVMPGKAFSFSFGLEAKASGLLQYIGSSASASALNSLTFAKTGDVFNLPDGYTIEIAEATIQNNRYVPVVATVPLPAGGFALVLALGALGALRRRQR